jgi:hypothetical protein
MGSIANLSPWTSDLIIQPPFRASGSDYDCVVSGPGARVFVASRRASGTKPYLCNHIPRNGCIHRKLCALGPATLTLSHAP